MSSVFAHLHTHSKYSIQDGLVDPQALMKRCNDYGMSSVAVSDHGNIAGVWECSKYAKKYGINLIPGCEMYLVPDGVKCRGKDWGKGKSCHIVLLAADKEGWQNILLLTAYANTTGFYHEPRIDLQTLEKYFKGLFCLSGCLGGWLGKAFFRGDSVALAADRLHQIFGDRFSLEIQLNGLQEQVDFNAALIEVHKTSSIPLVATVDAHYLEKSDSHKQDLLFALQLDNLLDDPKRLKLPERQHSVEAPNEVISKFVAMYGRYGQSAIDRTVEIAENCKANVETESKDYKIPSYDVYTSPDFNEFQLWLGKQCSCHSTNGECLIHKNCKGD